MTELFTDISETDKQLTRLVVDLAFNLKNVPQTIKYIEEYRANCTPAVQDFVDFYV